MMAKSYASRRLGLTGDMSSRPLPLAGRTAIVTGSTDGIGFAIACRLVRDGASVVICSRKQENVNKALEALCKEFGSKTKMSGTVFDASSFDDVEHLVEHAVKKWGGIDILVCNAGLMMPGSVLNDTLKNWDDKMTVNLKSPFLLIQKIIPIMQKKGKGAIVLLASDIGFCGFQHDGVYSVAKAAVMSLTKQFAVTCGPLNIRVNCVAPGLVKTELSKEAWVDENLLKLFTSDTIMKRLGTTDEIAGVVGFLCSDDSSFITGETIVANGGRHVRY